MTHMTLQAVRQLIANDSYAITFQSVEQYRGTLLRHFDSLVEAPSPEWGRVRTVGDMVRNLLTLDQAEPIFSAFHVDFDGARRCRTSPISISHERVIDGKWVDSTRKDVPYSTVVWAKPDERAQQAAAPGALPERDPSKPTEQQGLFRKFEGCRTDGGDQPGGKHHGCRYYVLDLTHDQHAPAAMRAYAAACAVTHPLLAADIVAEFGAAPRAPGTPEAPAEPIAWMDPSAGCVMDAFLWQKDPSNPQYSVPVYTRAAQLDGGQGEGSHQCRPAT